MTAESSSSSTSTIPNRKDRQFDVLVYGATGYTGSKVAKHLIENHPNVKVAISGRNYDKLVKVAEDIQLPNPESSILIASIPKEEEVVTGTAEDEESANNNNNNNNNHSELYQAFIQTKIVLACAGPYRHMGEKIVSTCIQTRTDYLDLCGEPQFFNDMLCRHDTLARENKTLILSACAFDCVPAELSVQLAKSTFKSRYASESDSNTDENKNNGNEDDVGEDSNNTYSNPKITNIEVIHTFEGVAVANPTTFHAAVDGFHASITGELKKSRKEVETKLNVPKPPRVPRSWPTFIQSPNIQPLFHEDMGMYLLKFMGADAACVLASDRYNRYRRHLDDKKEIKLMLLEEQAKKKEVQVEKGGGRKSNLTEVDRKVEEIVQQQHQEPHPKLSLCFGVPSQSIAYQILAYGAVFSTLARYEWGCKLLHSNPELFTNGVFRTGGPTNEELKLGSFKTYCSVYGMTKDQCVKVTCEGPEPGYVATPAMMVALTLTVLHHRDEIQYDGGVMVPGAAFGKSTVVYELLRKEGVNFQVVENFNDKEDAVEEEDKLDSTTPGKDVQVDGNEGLAEDSREDDNV